MAVRGIFRNFRDCFGTVGAEFSGLFSDSQNRIFRTIFGQSRTVLRFGFNPETNVFGFCGVFWYHSSSMTNREGTKRCPVLYGSEIWSFFHIPNIYIPFTETHSFTFKSKI